MLTIALLALAGLGVPAPAAPAHTGWLSGLPEPVPEASSLALLIAGMAAVGVSVRRRHARAEAEQGDPAHPTADEASSPTFDGRADSP